MRKPLSLVRRLDFFFKKRVKISAVFSFTNYVMANTLAVQAERNKVISVVCECVYARNYYALSDINQWIQFQFRTHTFCLFMVVVDCILHANF